ncbi:Flagellar FliJ protein [Botrimarina colliarenosi]|uniref:Flagellar FliJ protein n=1 Tax=Botrimarina colliarenosi TaxID=2528001 RepID=A0A5C6AM31_9BACT|nr:flagellar export protein FliJ [Botrimarina colliarenosi]TWU00329.1 Flagellar FliJ protein [Botrimarina colliarenosi]
MRRPFRLETVARLREARRDAARAQLADGLRAAEVLATKHEELTAQFTQLLEERRLAAARLDTAWLMSAGRYELVLRADERTLNENIAAVDREIDRRRQLVAEADREVRAIEVLRERQEEAERKEAARREAKLMDEHGSRMAFAQRRRSSELTQEI